MKECRFFLSFDQFRRIYDAIPGEPEFSICFDSDIKYMIIKYQNEVSFQRCGNEKERSGELFYPDLDALYEATTVDHICLKRDWERIEVLIVNDTFTLSNNMREDIEWICKRYHIDLES